MGLGPRILRLSALGGMFAAFVPACGDDAGWDWHEGAPPPTAIVADPNLGETSRADLGADPGADPGADSGADPGIGDAEGLAEAAARLGLGGPHVADREPVFPDEPYKVLLLGDSLAATGFGVILQKRLDAHPHVRCFRKARSATGLARPDVFDWMAEGKRQVELREPDLVVVVLGGNDGQDLTNERGTGKRVHWSSDDWDEAYQARVLAFLEEISDGGERGVVWLGLPKMGQRGLERKLELIREVQRDAVAELGDKGTYLDTIPFLVDDDGALLREVKVNKRTQRVREDDGVHFTMPGSQYFADQVYPQVLNVLGLQPVDQ